MGLFRPSSPGKWMAISALNVRVLTERHVLQDIWPAMTQQSKAVALVRCNKCPLVARKCGAAREPEFPIPQPCPVRQNRLRRVHFLDSVSHSAATRRFCSSAVCSDRCSERITALVLGCGVVSPALKASFQHYAKRNVISKLLYVGVGPERAT